jgi:hypothetical protein
MLMSMYPLSIPGFFRDYGEPNSLSSGRLVCTLEAFEEYENKPIIGYYGVVALKRHPRPHVGRVRKLKDEERSLPNLELLIPGELVYFL